MPVSTPNHNVNLFAIRGATPCICEALVFTRLAGKVDAPTTAAADAPTLSDGTSASAESGTGASAPRVSARFRTSPSCVVIGLAGISFMFSNVQVHDADERQKSRPR